MRVPSRRPLLLTLSVACLAGVLSAAAPARAQQPCDPPAAGMAAPPYEEHPGARRESQFEKPPKAGEEAPQIGFIDSPTSTCYQPDPAADVCYINWYYLAVDASPNYMICMEVTINAIGKVSASRGFFQTSMYVPYNMHYRGFKVQCGPLGGGGDPNRGNAYAYTIRAQDSASLKSANYGTVYCPAYIP